MKSERRLLCVCPKIVKHNFDNLVKRVLMVKSFTKKDREVVIVDRNIILTWVDNLDDLVVKYLIG